MMVAPVVVDAVPAGTAGDVRIRDAAAADVRSIVALLADDDLGRGREGPVEPLAAGYLQAFEEIDASPAHRLVVATLDDEVVGTLQLSYLRYLTYRGGLRAQIEGVRVAAKVRGQGVGRRLFTWAIERARDEGAHLVQLTTDTRRPDALRFYEQLGFRASHHGLKLHLPGHR